MVGGVLCACVAPAPHPPFFCCFVCLFVLLCGCGGWGFTEGLGVLQGWWGLWGVVDVGDEFVLVLTITAAHVRFLCVAWTL